MRELGFVERVGNMMVETFHFLGLFVIGATIVWSAAHEYLLIMEKGHASLGDILLLFIYLELGAMIGIFFRTHRLPVIFLLFISITALTRYLAIDMKTMDDMTLIILSGAILVLSIAAFVIRYAEHHYERGEEDLAPLRDCKDK